jgi:molecular chaperone DnaK (HSP70)
MPAVRRFIKNMTGIEPVVKDINPDEAVALGAAVQVMMIVGSRCTNEVWP